VQEFTRGPGGSPASRMRFLEPHGRPREAGDELLTASLQTPPAPRAPDSTSI
jgi:hypothetical protein